MFARAVQVLSKPTHGEAMKSYSHFTFAILARGLFAGCHEKVSLSCVPQAPAIGDEELANFGAFGTQNLGFIDINGAGLGDVYQLDLTPTKDVFVNPAGHVQYDQANAGEYIKNSPATSTAQIAISWQFDATAKSELDASQQAAIQAASKKNWSLNLVNVSNTSVVDSLTLINSKPENAALKSNILANPTSIFMILNPTLVGNSSEISVTEGTSATASESIKIGWAITVR